MKILNYEMVNAKCEDSLALEKRVKELVALGWEVMGVPMLGSPRGAGARLFQCLVLPDPVGNKSCRWVAPTATEPGRWEPLKLAAASDS